MFMGKEVLGKEGVGLLRGGDVLVVGLGERDLRWNGFERGIGVEDVNVVVMGKGVDKLGSENGV